MNTIGQYIASILLALFALTIVPYNALHSHAEDEHTAALLHHENYPSHHCELDSNVCQPAPGADCGHPAHLTQSHPKCFTCDFHFIKVYEGHTAAVLNTQHVASMLYREYVPVALHKAFFFVGNKGPPFAA